MSNNISIKKLADLDNISIDVKVSPVSKSTDFMGFITVTRFNPEQILPSGGPVMTKNVVTQAMGKNYDDAFNNVLDRAVELLGL